MALLAAHRARDGVRGHVRGVGADLQSARAVRPGRLRGRAREVLVATMAHRAPVPHRGRLSGSRTVVARSAAEADGAAGEILAMASLTWSEAGVRGVRMEVGALL